MSRSRCASRMGNYGKSGAANSTNPVATKSAALHQANDPPWHRRKVRDADLSRRCVVPRCGPRRRGGPPHSLGARRPPRDDGLETVVIRLRLRLLYLLEWRALTK